MHDEKSEGKRRPRKQIEDFQNAIDLNGLFDVGWKGQKFTWSNRHRDKIFTKERLNKSIANHRWLEKLGIQGV